MIAEDEERPDIRMIVGTEPLDDLRRVGTAIDQVADEDQQYLLRRTVLQVMLDLRQELVEQIETPMHIAHGIGPPPAYAGGAALPFRSEVEHSAPLSPG